MSLMFNNCMIGFKAVKAPVKFNVPTFQRNLQRKKSKNKEKIIINDKFTCNISSCRGRSDDTLMLIG